MFHKIISLMVGKREKRGGRSAWTLCSGLPLWIARQNRRARRAQARQPRTTLFSHLPTLYSTEAHCIVATHYPLLPSPYSLLNGSPLHSGHALPSPPFSLLSTQRKPTAKWPRTTLSSLLPTLYFHHSQFPRMTIQYTSCRASPVACSASNARKQIITILFATSYNI